MKSAAPDGYHGTFFKPSGLAVVLTLFCGEAVKSIDILSSLLDPLI